MGLANQAGFMKDNKMPRVGKALAADSTAMLAGSLLGTSPVGAYVESSAGLLWVVVQESQLLQPGFYLFSVCYFLLC